MDGLPNLAVEVSKTMQTSGSKISRALLIAGFTLVAACTAVGPDFEQPEAPVASSWLDADDERVDTSSTAYQDWWQVFDDPVLAQLIDIAYR